MSADKPPPGYTADLVKSLRNETATIKTIISVRGSKYGAYLEGLRVLGMKMDGAADELERLSVKPIAVASRCSCNSSVFRPMNRPDFPDHFECVVCGVGYSRSFVMHPPSDDRADAKRYRFLRGGVYHAGTEASFKGKDGCILMRDELDAAIDAAMNPPVSRENDHG